MSQCQVTLSMWSFKVKCRNCRKKLNSKKSVILFYQLELNTIFTVAASSITKHLPPHYQSFPSGTQQVVTMNKNHVIIRNCRCSSVCCSFYAGGTCLKDRLFHLCCLLGMKYCSPIPYSPWGKMVLTDPKQM